MNNSPVVSIKDATVSFAPAHHKQIKTGVNRLFWDTVQEGVAKTFYP